MSRPTAGHELQEALTQAVHRLAGLVDRRRDGIHDAPEAGVGSSAVGLGLVGSPSSDTLGPADGPGMMS